MSLACRSPRGLKESDMTEPLNNSASLTCSPGMISNIHKDNFYFFLVWENHTFSSSRSFLAWLEFPCVALARFPSGWVLSPWIAYFWLFWFLSHLTAGESRAVYRVVFLICWLILHHCLFRWLTPREGRQCISHPCQSAKHLLNFRIQKTWPKFQD